MNNPAVPKYLPDVLALTERLRGKPGIYHMLVTHDEWCDLLNRRGPCNCEPITRLVRPS